MVACSYLQDYLFEVGPAGSSGLGQAPLSFQELDAWARRVPRGLQPWEFLFMRRLSMEWCAESARAVEPDAVAPWAAPAPSQEEAQRVGDNLRDTIRRMAGKGAQ